MTPQQRIQLVIILIFVGSGVIRWLFQRLQEQAAKKRALDAVEQRRLEALRTGRNLNEIQEQAAAPAREQVETAAAAKRRAQIEEFRRRQQERTAQRSQTFDVPKPIQQTQVATGPIGRIPGSAGPTVPMPSRKPPRVAAPPTPQQKSRAPQAGPAPRPTRQPAEPAPQRASAEPPAPPQASPRRIEPLVTAPQTPEQWRRAIVINAILGPAPGLSVDADPRQSPV